MPISPQTVESRHEALRERFGGTLPNLSSLRCLIAYELKYSRTKPRFEMILRGCRAFGLYYCITTKRVMSLEEIARLLGYKGRIEAHNSVRYRALEFRKILYGH